MRGGEGVELVDHRVGLLGAEAVELGDLRRDRLDLALAEVVQDLRGLVLAELDQQDGRLADALLAQRGGGHRRHRRHPPCPTSQPRSSGDLLGLTLHRAQRSRPGALAQVVLVGIAGLERRGGRQRGDRGPLGGVPTQLLDDVRRGLVAGRAALAAAQPGGEEDAGDHERERTGLEHGHQRGLLLGGLRLGERLGRGLLRAPVELHRADLDGVAAVGVDAERRGHQVLHLGGGGCRRPRPSRARCRRAGCPPCRGRPRAARWSCRPRCRRCAAPCGSSSPRPRRRCPRPGRARRPDRRPHRCRPGRARCRSR